MKTEFFITRDSILLADGEVIDRFPSEEAAASMAIRFAQGNDWLHSILYERN